MILAYLILKTHPWNMMWASFAVFLVLSLVVCWIVRPVFSRGPRGRQVSRAFFIASGTASLLGPVGLYWWIELVIRHDRWDWGFPFYFGGAVYEEWLHPYHRLRALINGSVLYLAILLVVFALWYGAERLTRGVERTQDA